VGAAKAARLYQLVGTLGVAVKGHGLGHQALQLGRGLRVSQGGLAKLVHDLLELALGQQALGDGGHHHAVGVLEVERALQLDQGCRTVAPLLDLLAQEEAGLARLGEALQEVLEVDLGRSVFVLGDAGLGRGQGVGLALFTADQGERGHHAGQGEYRSCGAHGKSSARVPGKPRAAGHYQRAGGGRRGEIEGFSQRWRPAPP